MTGKALAIYERAGAPTLYKDEYAEQAFKYCLLGAIDKELATFFEVCVDTINEWKKVHPEFSASIANGKAKADAEVAHSTYRDCIGYEHKGRFYPGDGKLGLKWLHARQPDKWREQATEHDIRIELVSYVHNTDTKRLDT